MAGLFRRIPGFRSGTWWKQLAASAVYLVAAFSPYVMLRRLPGWCALLLYLKGTNQLRGVNRSGAEWGNEWDGWNGQTHYEWPTATTRSNEFNYFLSKNMNVIRLPISWERLQHELGGPLDPTYLQNLLDYFYAATAFRNQSINKDFQGFYVIIDLHNYGRYATGAFNSSGDQVATFTQHKLGDGTLTFAHVADVWTKIAKHFVINENVMTIQGRRVIFNLMNEQHDAHPSLDSTAIFAGYQTVEKAIRATGAKQMILFPNTRSSDTSHWSKYSPQGGPLDRDAAVNVTDSVFDMHSYSSIDNWIDDIKNVTDWARRNNKRLFLSELGTEDGPAVVSKLLSYIRCNGDVWVGWTMWNLAPYQITTTDKLSGAVSPTPKMAWYERHFLAYLNIGD